VIAGDQFVLLHVPKTAGTWAKQTLQKVSQPDWGLRVGAWEEDDHATWKNRPHWCIAEKAIVCVRNPWDWYVSRYEFERTSKRRLKVPLPWPRLPFRQAVLLMPSPAELFEEFTEGAPHLIVMRFEELPRSLPRALREAGVEVHENTERAICSTPPTNVTRHAHYRTYYNDATRQMVARRDAALIERFGYEF
jgi:hypothetical protein